MRAARSEHSTLNGDRAPRSRRRSLAAAAPLVFLTLFVALLATAAWLYPGGTVFDAHTRGFGWANYWCDLTRTRGFDGGPMPAPWLAQCAMIAFGLALASLYELARLRLGLIGLPSIAVRGAAWLSALGVTGVAFIPYDTARGLHFAATFLAGPGALVSIVALAAWMARRNVGGGWLVSLGGLTVVAGLAGLVFYVRQAMLGGAESALLPVTQKIAALFVTCWIASAAIALGYWGNSYSQNQ